MLEGAIFISDLVDHMTEGHLWRPASEFKETERGLSVRERRALVGGGRREVWPSCDRPASLVLEIRVQVDGRSRAKIRLSNMWLVQGRGRT